LNCFVAIIGTGWTYWQDWSYRSILCNDKVVSV